MRYTNSWIKFWNYLQVDFLYRVHRLRLRRAIKVLMGVVLNALVLAGLYALFGETVLPTLKQREVDMFNYGK